LPQTKIATRIDGETGRCWVSAHCPHCKSILLPEKSNGEVVLICDRCKYINEITQIFATTPDKPEQSGSAVSRKRRMDDLWP